MSMHTKGPWSVGRMLDPKDAPAIIGDEDSVVAILPGKWNHCSYIAADARLIAAAPSYFDASEAIFKAVENNAAPVNVFAALREMALDDTNITIHPDLLIALFEAHAAAAGSTP